jgi:hypothetical protein
MYVACVYDDCYADDQCTDGAVCECREATLGGNGCLSSGCRVDADCPGSWCSPTMGPCGAYAGTVGYQCHTPEDECTNDVDCASPNGHCIHSPEVGHWVCSYLQCVG